jgi:hypothetical protein
MGILPTPSEPFGFLEPLHQYILANAQPISVTNAYQLSLIPLIPLALQTYLLQIPGTRSYRAALAVVGITLIIRAFLSYRFPSECC